MKCPTVAGLTLLLALPAFAQTALPPQAQAEVLVHKITASMEAGNAQEALDLLAEYRKLGVKMPPTLLFLEGRLAAIAKNYARSKKVLSEYLARPEAHTDRNYATAIALYADVAKEVEASYKTKCAASVLSAAPVVLSRQAGAVFRECPVAPEMVIIPSGSFLMGSSEKEKGRSEDEGPQHQVSVKALAVGRYEVTFDEWDACVDSGGCNSYSPADNSGRGRQPVINIGWNDAQQYISWLRRVTGKKYRLLSESEFEYSSLSGRSNFSYTRTGEGIFSSREVGEEGSNPFGLSDMNSNIWEWVQDCYNDSYHGAPSDGTAWLTGDCSNRVVRGGIEAGEILSLASRRHASLSIRDIGLGFRVARDLD